MIEVNGAVWFQCQMKPRKHVSCQCLGCIAVALYCTKHTTILIIKTSSVSVHATVPMSGSKKLSGKSSRPSELPPQKCPVAINAESVAQCDQKMATVVCCLKLVS